jgi:hypothetical protein
MKDVKSIILAIIFFLGTACGLWLSIEIIKGVLGGVLDLIGGIFE